MSDIIPITLRRPYRSSIIAPQGRGGEEGRRGGGEEGRRGGGEGEGRGGRGGRGREGREGRERTMNLLCH